MAHDGCMSNGSWPQISLGWFLRVGRTGGGWESGIWMHPRVVGHRRKRREQRCDTRMADDDDNGGPCLLYDYIAQPQKLYDSCFQCRRPFFVFNHYASSGSCACDVPRVMGPLRQAAGATLAVGAGPRSASHSYPQTRQCKRRATGLGCKRKGSGRQVLYTKEKVRSEEAHNGKTSV
jgi:hypothetical protein